MTVPYRKGRAIRVQWGARRPDSAEVIGWGNHGLGSVRDFRGRGGTLTIGTRAVIIEDDENGSCQSTNVFPNSCFPEA